MIQDLIEIKNIKFDLKEYPDYLKDSLNKRGVLISLKLAKHDDYYECIDGHKRLSCILNENLNITKVPATIINDFTKQGSTYWGPRNKH